MRILVVTDGYPPDGRTAVARSARDIAEGLAGRGHDVRVLAGEAAPGMPAEEGFVRRCLFRDRRDRMAWQDVFRKELENQTALCGHVREFQPDAVLFFGLSRISASLPLLAEDLGIPACLHVESDGLAGWEKDLWFREQPRDARGRRALRILSRRFRLAAFPRPLHGLPAIFTSRYFLEATVRAGKELPRAAVIPRGIDIRRFPFKEAVLTGPARLLHAGPPGPLSGAAVAVAALGLLKRDPLWAGLRLTVAGPYSDAPDDLADLRARAEAAGVLEAVSFEDTGPEGPSPDLYREHDVFVRPAFLVEPAPSTLLEAMASGLGIVATASGGSAEILQDGVNAAVAFADDPETCASGVRRLIGNPALLNDVRTGARRTVEEKYGFDREIEAVESFLSGVREGFRPPIGLPTTEADRAARFAGIPRHPKVWFRLSGWLVRVRSVFKPVLLKRKVVSVVRARASRASLAVFPLLYRAVHRFGRGRARRPEEEPREILVVQPADLGDVVLTGPFLRNLRAFAPGSRIVLAVHPGLVSVAEACPHVDEIFPFPYRTFPEWNSAFSGSFRWWRDGLRLARRTFSKRRFDLAVSVRWNDDAPQAAALILMAASGAPKRVAYLNTPAVQKAKGLNKIYRLVTDGLYRGAEKHEVEYQADLLRFMGGRANDLSLEVWTTPDDDRRAGEILAAGGIGPGDLAVAFAPGARWEFRRWPADRFAALGRWLQEAHGAKVLILAGKSEEALAAEVARGLVPERTLNLAGRTTIREMAAVLTSCRYFLGNDSGPMHVAAAAGVAAVGLFGPGETARFRPWGPAHSVVHLGLTCNPCSQNCLFPEARCIRGLAIEQVKDVFARKLDSKRSS